MQNVYKFAVAALLLIGVPQLTFADDPQLELVAGSRTVTPDQWKMYCENYPGACIFEPAQVTVVQLNPDTRKVMEEVNRDVNTRITYQTDIDHWGWKDKRYVYTNPSGDDVDKWDYAEDGFGDCEDFALVKQKLLLEKGWPRSALLLTVVNATVEREVDGKKVRIKGGHLVLTVRTDQGDFILDLPDYTTEPKRWWETGHLETHEFRYRQSENDPNVWKTLETPKIANAN